MSNVRFQYLYRDGSNYKKWGDVVFSNADDLSIESIRKSLRGSFSDDGLFIAHQVRIPEVFLAEEYELDSDDHCFHEFADVEATSDAQNDPSGRSIGEFMTEAAKEAKIGWRAFDPIQKLSGRSR
jgi:hypothetical protein